MDDLVLLGRDTQTHRMRENVRQNHSSPFGVEGDSNPARALHILCVPSLSHIRSCVQEVRRIQNEQLLAEAEFCVRGETSSRNAREEISISRFSVMLDLIRTV